MRFTDFMVGTVECSFDIAYHGVYPREGFMLDTLWATTGHNRDMFATGVVFILRGLLSRLANSLSERAERECHSRFPVIAQRERSQIQDLSTSGLFPASSRPLHA